MKFCPECKSLMLPKNIDGEKVLACSCGYKEGATTVSFKEQRKKPEAEIAVVEKEESPNVIIEAECPACGHNKAEYWEVQTRSADEPPTKFHKCTKCKKVWRDYS